MSKNETHKDTGHDTVPVQKERIRLPQNIISTMVLGRIAGGTFQVPRPHDLYWHVENESYTRNKKKLWAKKNHGKEFHFIKRNGGKVKAIFDRSVGFLTEDEFSYVKRKRNARHNIFKNLRETSLCSELIQIKSVLKMPVQNASEPRPEAILKDAFPFPFRTGSTVFPSALFGVQHEPEKPDNVDRDPELPRYSP